MPVVRSVQSSRSRWISALRGPALLLENEVSWNGLILDSFEQRWPVR